MQLVLRINKTSIRMNNWVIFFHFEMIGIEFALKLFTNVWYMKHSKYIWENIHMEHNYIT